MALPLVAAGVQVLKSKAVKKVGSWLKGRLFGSSGKRSSSTAREIGNDAITYAGDQIITRMTGRPLGMPLGPPTGSFGAQDPRPREGAIGRTISRILPGGLTGYEGTPVEGTERDRYGRAIAYHADSREQYYAPRGYVLVPNFDDPEGPPIAMLRAAAIAMGLWRARPKPPISGYDARAIRRAHSVKKRVAKLAKKVARC